jgi:mono/diheme cytochrome c family protein
MGLNTIARYTVLAALAVGFGGTLAQGRSDPGKREFEANCASCHGVDGKGRGPYVDMLRRSPPDLTLLQKANNGVFPLARVYDVIEGAGVGHGARDMPVWGQDYRVQAAEYHGDMPYNPEAYVRSRILALTEYLSRLQAK